MLSYFLSLSPLSLFSGCHGICRVIELFKSIKTKNKAASDSFEPYPAACGDVCYEAIAMAVSGSLMVLLYPCFLLPSQDLPLLCSFQPLPCACDARCSFWFLCCYAVVLQPGPLSPLLSLAEQQRTLLLLMMMLLLQYLLGRASSCIKHKSLAAKRPVAIHFLMPLAMV
ncbi:hypothetical protein GOP47_0012995 [Adiantum capillus-veneris]|uniref:Uncharacterized protein n=1 Tax=Adiantum capillus-veneris TaxID=13818 RepID=A0A9D4URQ9_ADICA|nr:hypothetical protein GOP47_0012995 [Adiantum capillus-veneris]